MKKIILLSAVLVSVLGVLGLAAGKEKKKKPKNPEQAFSYRFSPDLKQTPDSEARLDKWYRDAKFGAFIHFGVYSKLAGKYKDQEVPWYGEWIQLSAKIRSKDYHAVAAEFNPTEFDADEWVKVFKDVGIRYVIITSKHHDGFALFDSAASSFNIVDFTPFKRDIIKELSEACHRNGLKFGVYYSQSQDWNEPDAPIMDRNITARFLRPELPADFEPDMDRYIKEKALPQIEELVKNYELDLFWFDTPKEITPERAKQFSDMVRKHRPDCLVNSRLIHGGKAKITKDYLHLFDYVSIGDKEIPDMRLPIMFETPDSVSSSYGYKKFGKFHYHSEKDLIERLVHTVCQGGNYLLNNGPMGNGKLDPQAVELYRAVGGWLENAGEAIYGTRPSPLLKPPTWGNISTNKEGTVLYLHITQWPETRKIRLDGLDLAIKDAVFLQGGRKTEFRTADESVEFVLPEKAPDQHVSVIKLSLEKPVSNQ